MRKETEQAFSEVMVALSQDERISIPLLFRLSDITSEEFDHFCQVWQDMEPERRRIITRHLADIAEENFEVDFTAVFQHCLSDSFAEVRMASLAGLWDSDRLTLIRPIIRLMESDPDAEVRSLAAATLGHYILLAEWRQIPESSVLPAVAALIEQYEAIDNHHRVRGSALESLGASSDPRVEALIENAYDSGDIDLQMSAVFAMGRSADTRWIPTIREEMASYQEEMRIEAARAAGGIGSSAFIPQLADLAWDDDLEVRLAAIGALGEIGGDRAMEILVGIIEDRDSEELHSVAEEALEQITWLGEDIDLSRFDWENDDID